MTKQNTQLAIGAQNGSAVLESLILNGDLSRLSADQKIEWYKMRCDAAGLDWRTKPFEYLRLSGKEVLYATKTVTEQLCEKRGLSCEVVKQEFLNDYYVVQARVHGTDGRKTDNIGVVTVGHLQGDNLANAMMKAVTKAFRRAVLSHCGMGMLDETEIETIPNAHPVKFQSETKSDATATLRADYEVLLEQGVKLGITRQELPESASVGTIQRYIDGLTAAIERKQAKPKPTVHDAVVAAQAARDAQNPMPDDAPDFEQDEVIEAETDIFDEPEKPRKKMQAFCAAATEKGLSMHPDNRQARLEAINQWLVESKKEPVRSLSEVDDILLSTMRLDVMQGKLTW